MTIVLIALAIELSLILILSCINRKYDIKYDIKRLVSTLIIVTIFLLLISSVIKYLNIEKIKVSLKSELESIKITGKLINLTLISVNIILSLINLLLAVNALGISNIIYLLYVSPLGKIINPIIYTLSIVSNMCQVLVLIFTAIYDIIVISAYLLKFTNIIVPLTLIKRVRSLALVILAIILISVYTSFYVASIITNFSISKNINSKLLTEMYNLTSSWHIPHSSNITVIKFQSHIPSLKIMEVVCHNHRNYTFIGIGNASILSPCNNTETIVTSYFYDAQYKPKIHCRLVNTTRRFREIICLLAEPEVKYLTYRGYLIGIYSSNCSSININIEKNYLIIEDGQRENCTVNLFIPESSVRRYSLNMILKIKKYLNSILKINSKAISIINNKNKIMNNIHKLEKLYRTIDNIKYYHNFLIHLRNGTRYIVPISINRSVLWPLHIDLIPYNRYSYSSIVRLILIDSIIKKLKLYEIFSNFYNKIMVCVLYYAYVSLFSIVSIIILTMAISRNSINITSILLRVCRSMLYDLVAIPYFKIISKIVGHKFIKHITELFHIKDEVILKIENSNQKVIRNHVKYSPLQYRQETYVDIFGKARTRMRSVVDSRILYELENRRKPILDLTGRRLRYGKYVRQIKTILKSIMTNLGIDYNFIINNFSLKKLAETDDITKYIITTYLNSDKRYYSNIIDISLDVRLAPIHIVLLSLRRDILKHVISRDENLYYSLSKYLDYSIINIRRRYREYVRDMYAISIYLSKVVHRKITSSLLLSMYSMRDLENSLTVRVVRRFLEEYIMYDTVNRLLEKYEKVSRFRLRGRELYREIEKVSILRKLFNIR